MNRPIQNYDDFTSVLLEAGFSMGGGNSDGIFAVISWGWQEYPQYETPVCWHTGDPETDPWEWRIRVLDERDDIAYAKMFFRKSGFVTRQWAPYFLAVRRGGSTLEEEYEDGLISRPAKRIYETILSNEVLPLHAIKQLGGFSKEEKSSFERALIELQMKMYITMCGTQQKFSKKGEEYGWSSTVFCTTESFWGGEIFEEAIKINKQVAIQRITEQIELLNPDADKKKILKFILG